MSDDVMIAVDPHKASNTAAVLDPVTKTLIETARFANSAEGYGRLTAFAARVGAAALGGGRVPRCGPVAGPAAGRGRGSWCWTSPPSWPPGCGADPDRASFTAALESAREQVITARGIEDPGRPGDAGRIGRAVLAGLLPARRARYSARKVKCSTSRYHVRDQGRPELPTRITRVQVTIIAGRSLRGRPCGQSGDNAVAPARLSRWAGLVRPRWPRRGRKPRTSSCALAGRAVSTSVT